MKTFVVHIAETNHRSKLLQVEARSEEEAQRLAEELYQADRSEQAPGEVTTSVLAEDGEPLALPEAESDGQSPKLPTAINHELTRILSYLWVDEAADYLETSPREGREEHIFLSLLTVRRWLAGRKS